MAAVFLLNLVGAMVRQAREVFMRNFKLSPPLSGLIAEHQKILDTRKDKYPLNTVIQNVGVCSHSGQRG
jgi:hypothetical protein